MTIVASNPNPNRTADRANLYIVRDEALAQDANANAQYPVEYPHDETYESNGFLNNTDL